MSDLKSTIPLLPWLSYQWSQIQPEMFDWVKVCEANKYRVMLAAWNNGGDWVLNPDKSPDQTGIQVTGDRSHIKLKFEDYGTFMQQEFWGYETTVSGTLWCLEVIWKPLVRTE